MTTLTSSRPAEPLVGSAATTVVPSRLDDLVFARAATAHGPQSNADIARATRVYAPATFEDTRWTTAIADSVERLRAGNALDSQQRAIGGGTAAARRFRFSGAVTWKRIVHRIVPGLALGIPGDDAKSHNRLKDSRSWAAAVVGRAHGLWRQGPPPTWTSMCDAIVWRSLHLTGNVKRTPPEIRAHFVGLVLGASSGPPDRMIRLLAARETGAARADLRALREALVRRWLCGQEITSTVHPAAATVPSSDLAGFATAVREAAARSTDGGFGARKVFIANVWRTLRDHPAARGLSLDEFKHRLIAAHKAGLVGLARADLVGAMDPDAVRESETVHLEARYHFVERESTP